jgi:hypothetical protein
MRGAGFVDLRDWRLYHDAEPLHVPDPRIPYDMLVELGAAWMLASEIDTLVTRYLAAFTTQTVH